MSDFQVIGLGALNMDYLYRVDRILGDGEAVVKESITSPGGSAANTIYGLAKLGIKTGFAGAVGDDGDGFTLVKDFESAGVDTRSIRIKKGVRSGAVLCLTDTWEKRSLYVSPGANSLLEIGDIDLDYINSAEILHLSSFAGEAQLEMCASLMNKLKPSVKISFSPGALWASKKVSAIEPILRRTNILFLNYREITKMTGQKLAMAAETCQKLGVHTVVVTLGKGRTLEMKSGTVKNAVCYISEAGKEYAADTHAEREVEADTTGAGDAFAAGFLYGQMRDKQPIECAWLGDIVARFVISKVGARPGYPMLSDLNNKYSELYLKPL